MRNNSVSVYNSVAEKYSTTFTGPNEFLEIFAKMLPRNSEVLDAGCGVGDDSYYLHSRGFSVNSFDASKKMIAVARNRLPKIKFKITDIRKMKLSDRSFDGIVAAFCLIHLKKSDVKKVIKNFSRALKSNGLLYIALQEGEGEKMITEPLDPKREIFVNFYRMEEIKKLLAESGFDVVFSKKIPYKGKSEFKNYKIFIIARGRK
ncbi:MAG TPA: class I SAM-dependent methyltransferase [archaeon]|nr:class I SAM-dependent methyltransferase [archaeon]